MKKVLKGKGFAYLKEVKQKTAEALKGMKNQWVQKLFWAVDKSLFEYTASNEYLERFEGDWSLNV